MAHGKEANDANSDLQELIANEVYDYRRKTESTGADAEITSEEGSFEKKHTIHSTE